MSPCALRAARAVAALPLPLGLLEYFASDSLTVAAPVLAAATLDASQWPALHAAADAETRRFITTLHPELKIEPHVEPARDPSRHRNSSRRHRHRCAVRFAIAPRCRRTN